MKTSVLASPPQADPELAAGLHKRAHALLPAQLEVWDVCDFNDRLRYHRYDRQPRFTWHMDGTVRIGSTVESFLTEGLAPWPVEDD